MSAAVSATVMDHKKLLIPSVPGVDKTRFAPVWKLKGSISKIIGLALLMVLNDKGLAQAPKPREEKPQPRVEKPQPADERPRPNIFDQIKEKAGEVTGRVIGNPPNNSLLTAYVPTIGQKTPCGNGDFEGGIILSQWQGAYGTVANNGTINFSGLTDGIVGGTSNVFVPSTHHLLVPNTNDPNGLPQTANATPCGPSHHAFRIGQLHAGSGVDLLSKTFVVTPAQSNISFWYSAVFQNPGNMPQALRPSFWVRVSVGGVEIPNAVNIGGTVNPAKLVADSTNTGLQLINVNAGTPSLLYKPWSCAQINLSQQIGQTVTIEFVTTDSVPTPAISGRYAYAYLDNFCATCCTTPPTTTTSKFCCPTPNLLANGDFEQGNTGFGTQYTFNPATTPAFATVPGQYNVVTGNQALGISPLWIVADHSTCLGNLGRFLVVNGRTTQPVNTTKIIWQQTVTVKQNTEYRFCVNVKNLPQATFDIKPKIRVRFTPAIANIGPTVVNWPGPACNWQLLSANFYNSGATSLTIQIELDEAGLGDGNDLAIDDISLHETPPVPVANVTWNFATQHLGNGQYNIQAHYPANIATTTPPCTYAWLVGELDANNNWLWPTLAWNPSSWQTYPPSLVNNFNGYNGTSTVNLTATTPGVFLSGKRYRILYAARCECEGWRAMVWDFAQPPAALKPQITPGKLREQDMMELYKRLNEQSPRPLPTER